MGDHETGMFENDDPRFEESLRAAADESRQDVEGRVYYDRISLSDVAARQATVAVIKELGYAPHDPMRYEQWEIAVLSRLRDLNGRVRDDSERAFNVEEAFRRAIELGRRIRDRVTNNLRNRRQHERHQTEEVVKRREGDQRALAELHERERVERRGVISGAVTGGVSGFGLVYGLRREARSRAQRLDLPVPEESSLEVIFQYSLGIVLSTLVGRVIGPTTASLFREMRGAAGL